MPSCARAGCGSVNVCVCVWGVQLQNFDTSVALRRMIINWSARCIKNRVNLWQRTSSISSACLIIMDTRTELTEGSILHFSLSLRQMTIGFNISSLLPLDREFGLSESWLISINNKQATYPISTSGYKRHQLVRNPRADCVIGVVYILILKRF